MLIIFGIKVAFTYPGTIIILMLLGGILWRDHIYEEPSEKVKMTKSEFFDQVDLSENAVKQMILNSPGERTDGKIESPISVELDDDEIKAYFEDGKGFNISWDGLLEQLLAAQPRKN